MRSLEKDFAALDLSTSNPPFPTPHPAIIDGSNMVSTRGKQAAAVDDNLTQRPPALATSGTYLPFMHVCCPLEGDFD